MQKTILVAEDEKEIRNILITKLKDSGFNVLSCADGFECETILMSNKPDLLLLDIMMPKKDGMELIKELSQYEWGKNVPVIILSNKSDYGTQNEAWYNGVKLYLVKAETSLDEVVRRINEVLEEK